MFLSQMTEAIALAGYDSDVIRDAQRIVFERIPRVFDEIQDQPLSVAQADPIIPNELAFAVLEEFRVPAEVLELV